jgi:hypothetical protein
MFKFHTYAVQCTVYNYMRSIIVCQPSSYAGISHVRIPVAYWYWDVADDEPFPAPNLNDNDPYSPLFYLKRMLGWLQVLPN